MASVSIAAEPAINRGMITVSVMLATIMTVLDSTIANVALPRMAGSISASPDEITWVLTSYIVAAAIMTPTTGWLTGRFGAKRLFIVTIIGFTAASALCGAAQSLQQIVLFRVLQGVFGAAMNPLSQMVLLNTYPLEDRGRAMAVWGMGVVVAPIVGPVLGGWLTDDFSWRWVFYINLPVGALSLLGVMTFIPSDKNTHTRRFDFTGFILLSTALAAFQLFLDRGQIKDWFQSPEVTIEAFTAAVALILFVFHTLTSEHSFLPVELLLDRNYVTAVLMTLALGLLMFAVLALLPPMIETLMGYPVVTTGMVMAPRGIGTLISIFTVGRLIGRIDNRVLIATGFSLLGLSYFGMSHFTIGMNSFLIVITGLVQGFGTGFVFTPMSVLAFATLDPALRADGAGVSALMRNLGNSAGISLLQTLFTRNTQIVHARLVEGITPGNPLAQAPYLAKPYSLVAPGGLAALNNEVTRQASMVAYVDDFHMMFLISVAVIPLVLLLRQSNSPAPVEAVVLD